MQQEKYHAKRLIKTASPRSILVFSGRYHIISTVSIVNNCILSTLKRDSGLSASVNITFLGR